MMSVMMFLGADGPMTVNGLLGKFCLCHMLSMTKPIECFNKHLTVLLDYIGAIYKPIWACVLPLPTLYIALFPNLL